MIRLVTSCFLFIDYHYRFLFALLRIFLELLLIFFFLNNLDSIDCDNHSIISIHEGFVDGDRSCGSKAGEGD